MRGLATHGLLHTWARAEAATFVVVYQEEAHAEDEWLLHTARYAAPGKEDKPVMVKKHRNLADRRVAALTFASDFQVAGTEAEAASSLASALAAAKGMDLDASGDSADGAACASALTLPACSAGSCASAADAASSTSADATAACGGAGAAAASAAAGSASAPLPGEDTAIAIDAATGAVADLVEQGRAHREKAIAERRRVTALKQADRAALGPVKVPLLLDSMGNDFLRTYASWPIRYYIFAEQQEVEAAGAVATATSAGSAFPEGASSSATDAAAAGSSAAASMAAPPVIVELIGEPDEASYNGNEIDNAVEAIADGSFFTREARMARKRAAPPRSATGALPWYGLLQ